VDHLIEVRGVKLWHEISGDGEPVLQIHGAGFGHFNFAPATPILGREFRCIDYDQRGYGQSEKPEQDYDLEVWADDGIGMLDALGVKRAHIHGTSMGGMVAVLLAGKYPERVQSVVINCAAAKLGYSGQLIFRNWIDLIAMDGCGSRTLAELISWQALSKRYVETEEGRAGVDTIQQILRDSNEPRVMTQACQAMIDMDLREWVPKITSPALVVGGDEDVMTPWDQGPNGAGQQWIADHLPNGEIAVIKGSNHSTIFDGTEAHCRAVAEFFLRHPGAA
jgi:pimeloyl-ACP methyl ester carboxylesterase